MAPSHQVAPWELERRKPGALLPRHMCRLEARRPNRAGLYLQLWQPQEGQPRLPDGHFGCRCLGSRTGSRRRSRQDLRRGTNWSHRGRPESHGQEVPRQPDEVISFSRATVGHGRARRLGRARARSPSSNEGQRRTSKAARHRGNRRLMTYRRPERAFRPQAVVMTVATDGR